MDAVAAMPVITPLAPCPASNGVEYANAALEASAAPVYNSVKPPSPIKWNTYDPNVYIAIMLKAICKKYWWLKVLVNRVQ